jgi:hypothetical protein
MPGEPPPKLYTKKHFALAFSAIVVGASLGPFREFRASGAISGATLGASAVALVLGAAIVVVIGRYANRPVE